MKQLFNNSGISAIALRYSQMRRGKPVYPHMLVSLSPTRFKKPSHARRCLEGLANAGLLVRSDNDGWSITPMGSEYLLLNSKQYVGEYAKVRK